MTTSPDNGRNLFWTGFVLDALLMLLGGLPEELRLPLILIFIVFHGKVFDCLLVAMSYDHAEAAQLFGSILALGAITLLLVTAQEIAKMI